MKSFLLKITLFLICVNSNCSDIPLHFPVDPWKNNLEHHKNVINLNTVLWASSFQSSETCIRRDREAVSYVRSLFSLVSALSLFPSCLTLGVLIHRVLNRPTLVSTGILLTIGISPHHSLEFSSDLFSFLSVKGTTSSRKRNSSLSSLQARRAWTLPGSFSSHCCYLNVFPFLIFLLIPH